MNHNLLGAARVYFETFSQRDLAGLRKMFADTVSLVDWEIQAHGLDQVLEANGRIFTSVDSITVEPVRMAQSDHTVFAEILVHVNGDTTLNVVDILTFNEQAQITQVVAYKR